MRLQSTTLATLLVLAMVTSAVAQERKKGDALLVPKDNRSMALALAEKAPKGELDILILGVGYDASLEGRFLSQAREIENRIRSTAPFSDFNSKLVFRTALTSTDLGCIDRSASSPVLTSCKVSAVWGLQLTLPLHHELVVLQYEASLSNRPPQGVGGYGYVDSGNFQDFSLETYAVVLDGVFTAEVAAHEVGHSIGNLSDEYMYLSESPSWASPNCLEKKEMLLPYGPAQQGCAGSPKYFRPENSIMRSLDIPTYNRASVEWRGFPSGLRERLEYFTTPTPPPPPPPPPPAPPATPTGFRISLSGYRATISWDVLPGVLYKLEVGTFSGGSNLGIYTLTGGFQTRVSPGKYFVRLRAVVGELRSPPTREIVGTVR